MIQLYFIKALDKLLVYESEPTENIINNIHKFIQGKTKLNSSQYWLYANGVNLTSNTQYKLNHFDTIEVMPRIHGGNIFDDIIDDVKDAALSAVNAILSPIEEPIGDIISFFSEFGKLIAAISKGIVWFIMFVIWFFTDLLNPYNLATDFLGSLSRITRFVMLGIVDVLFSLVRAGFNVFGDSVMSGVFGFSPDDKGDDKDCNDMKCIETDYRQVPFTIIICTILMPPLGVLMEFGLSYWVNIIICGVLTLMFYFPGLLYALVLIYC